MKLSINVVDRLTSDGRQHEAHLTICVGVQQLHCIGVGETVEGAERELERVFTSAIKDLEPYWRSRSRP